MINRIISPRNNNNNNNGNNRDDKQSPLSRWDSGDDVEEGIEASPSSVIILGGDNNDNENHKNTDMVQQQLSPYYPTTSTPASGGHSKKKETRFSFDHNDKNNSEEVSSTDSTSTTASISNQRRRRRSNQPRSNLWSNLFFVLGSVLYLILAMDDLRWAKEARGIPTAVLQADDDVTWVDFRLSQQQEESATDGNGRRLSEFDNYDWNEMDLDIQAAAEALGWSQDLWDNGGSAFTEDLSWSELTPEQQEAASVMGYTREGWDGTAEEGGQDVGSTTTTTNLNAPTVPPQEEEGTEAPSIEWELYDWDELPPDVQSAYTVLGFDGGLWASGEATETNDLFWEQLTQAQRDAATFLGFTQAMWDGSDGGTDEGSVTAMPTTNNSITPTDMPVIPWEEYDWEELPTEIQDSYTLLGYTAASWSSGESVSTDELSWDQLSLMQKVAAMRIGYTKAMWDYEGDATVAEQGNGDGDSVFVEPTSTTSATTELPEEIAQWNEYYWSELPPDIQASYQILGWNEELWNTGGTARTDDLSWNELTDEEQEAAMLIGYTQETWIVTTTTDVDNSTTTVTAAPTTVASDPSVWNEYFWQNLPPSIQSSFAQLGWTQELWNDGGSARTDSLSWEELSPEEQQAATILGYTQPLWDNEEAASSLNYVSADDDYIFLVEASNTWVSRYMILYFAAAFSFVIVGIIDFCSGAGEGQWFHANMILAGLFGVVSAMMTEKHRLASIILNLISVHFFLLEGLAIVRFRLYQQRQKKPHGSNGPDVSLTSGLWWIPTMLIIADACFVIGAVMDVVLSYFYFDRSSDYDLTLARVFGFSTLLWLLSSLLYVLVSLAYCSCCLGKNRQQREEQSEEEMRRQKELQGMTFVSPLPNISPTNTNSSPDYH